MRNPNDPPFPPKYFIPIILPDHGISASRWFWRSWGWLIAMTGGINMLINGWIIYGVVGLLIGVVLGFWVSVFTTLILHKRQFERYEAFWFAVHYAAGAAIVAMVFYWLTSSWSGWKFNPRGFQLLSLYLPMLNFIIASGLVGWQMQRWFHLHRLDQDDASPTV
ncbi:MAG: hypothetical protein LCH85_12720 [Chloroflexi bacterium]|nr:hypothetical protein [Chloroflexota bacterium]